MFLISDEIYEAITYGDAEHVSPLEVAPALRDRCVLVNSLSKTYAMTGWRVGYCAGPVPLIQAMFLVLAQSSRGPATFIQDAAAEALTGPQDCVGGMREEYSRRRAQVMERAARSARDRAGGRLLRHGGSSRIADPFERNSPAADA